MSGRINEGADGRETQGEATRRRVGGSETTRDSRRSPGRLRKQRRGPRRKRGAGGEVPGAGDFRRRLDALGDAG